MKIFTDSRRVFLVAAALALAGLARPAAAQTITEFPLSNARVPYGVARGPDGGVWFTFGAGIGRISTDGTVTEFSIPTDYSQPRAIVAGPDGNLWFTAADFDEGQVALIGRITPAGVIREFPLPDGGSAPCDITAGPDGNLWFTECSISGHAIGRITPDGVITEFRLPWTGTGWVFNIAAGPDGNLWFTEPNGSWIGRITVEGDITGFPVAGFPGLGGITAGPDGNLWFTEATANKIGRITTAGVITEFALPTGPGEPHRIIAGPDGNLWFTEYAGNKIGRITTAGSIEEFPVPTAGSAPTGITVGPGGNIWFTELKGNQIGRIALTGSCLPDAATLCLNGRFRVQLESVRPQDGGSSPAAALPLTLSTGAFWFFDAANLEVIVKVLDGRSINGRFWVFCGALTNVEYRITVVDTETGAVKTYFNPQGQLASFADVSAF